MEAVLDSVTVQTKRTGNNPARWRGHLAVILRKPTAVTNVENFAALPYTELPSFIAALRSRHGEPVRALEFTIYMAARTGMTLGAASGEVDIAAGTWTVPWERMRARWSTPFPFRRRR